eukprot:scaffold504_cov141-Skeletonema_menzelii.AAC.3
MKPNGYKKDIVVAPASPPLTNDCNRRRLRSPLFWLCSDGYCCSSDVKMACDASLYQLRKTKFKAVLPPSINIVGVFPRHNEIFGDEDAADADGIEPLS